MNFNATHINQLSKDDIVYVINKIQNKLGHRLVIMAVSDHIITGEMGFMDTNYYMAEHAMIGISLDLIKKLEGQKQTA